jgi:hypothetical protein
VVLAISLSQRVGARTAVRHWHLICCHTLLTYDAQVWGLGPEHCYERINQTGGGCDAGHWSPHLGSGEPPYIANNRLLDPKVSAGRTNASALTDPAAAAAADRVFERAWENAAAARSHGSWNASAAWEGLIESLLPSLGLRLAPVAADRCGDGQELSMIGGTPSGECVRVLPL